MQPGWRLEFAEGRLTRMRVLTLATLALCIREGFAQPELAALRVNLIAKPMSRSAVRTLWNRIESFAAPRNANEKFGTTRRRMSTALQNAEDEGAIPSDL
jgi:hypothetical protein